MGWSRGNVRAVASGAQGRDRGGHGPLGADQHGQGGERLGDVDAPSELAGGDLAGVQVAQADPRGHRDQGVAGEPAVGDMRGVHPLHRRPDVGQPRVVDHLEL